MAYKSQNQSRAQQAAVRSKSGGRYAKANRGPNAAVAVAICLAAIAITAGLIAGCFYLMNQNKDDQQILANVSILGIDVGGMTKPVARYAVEAAIDGTYPKMNMVIAVGKDVIEITPAESGISIDVAAAVDAAYAYGRTGSANRQQEEQMNALRNGYEVDPAQFMTLNTKAIRAKINDLGSLYSSKFTQSTYEILGSKPELTESAEEPVCQTLVITLGTPEYSFDLEDLYQQVISAYYHNTFLVEAEYPAILPDPVDLEAIYEEYYAAPVNAVMDEKTFEVAPASYGYGFDLDLARAMLNDAKYGQTLEIPFARIAPEVLSESLSGVLFRDVLGTYTATSASDKDRDVNLALACKSIDGMVLYPGDLFSYNQALGERTEANGYRPGASYSGNDTVYTVGGGICQVSSSLYYCALMGDLTIVERESHAFAPAYMPLGVDATVNWGTLDFCFRNSTDYPIRIEASASGGTVTVTLLGTDERNYYVKITSELIRTHSYETTYQEMTADNKDGYKDGDVIVSPYTGHDVETYRCKYSKETNELISKDLEAVSNYRKRDAVICKIINDSQGSEDGTVPPELIGGGIQDSEGALPSE